MERKTANVIAIIGFSFLGLALIAIGFVAILFATPNTQMLGMVAVNERDTEIVYKDSTIEQAFTNGNFIIDSTNCNVVVRMSSAGYAGEGTIIVHESATGIAFNSFNRTLIEWTTTLVGDVPYLKIKILEPSGVVFNNHPTTVYLNLKHQATLHNFILQNMYGKVNFEFGDEIEDDVNQLHIDNLVVMSAATVNIPSYETMDINHVEILSNNTKFSCGAVVKQDVVVSGYNGSQNFDAAIMGDVKVYGARNKFRANSAHNVAFIDAEGSLSLEHANKLDVHTTMADVTVVDVAEGVKMDTQNGALSISEIISGGLTFKATGSAHVDVSKSLSGNVNVIHEGTGSINLNGVAGNVDIESTQINGGDINVNFKGQDRYSVKIRGYDGNINVDNINGATDIRVRDSGSSGAAGRADINVSFKQITEDNNWIVTGGYVGSSGIGNITVTLVDGWRIFDLYIYGATQARDYNADHDGKLFTNVGNDLANEINWGSGGTKGKLTVSTPSYFHLR